MKSEAERRGINSEVQKQIVIGVAALFRAASIAKGEENNNRWENTHAIKEATEFVNACKQYGLWPESAELEKKVA